MLGVAVLRQLSDRGFERRKAGASEVEKALRRLREGGVGNAPTIRKTVIALAADFACSVS